MAKIEIKHSSIGEYYELYINGALMGTYDTVAEAARDYEATMREDGGNE